METKKLAVNDFFEVVLQGKATSGYLWQYEISNKKIISVIEKKQSFSTVNNIIPGSSVEEIFRITAQQKGESELRFYLTRSWEPDTIPPKAEKKIQVTVS